MRDDERRILTPWLDAFERRFGAAVAVVPHPFSSIEDLSCLRFPRVLSPPELLGGTGHFVQSRALVAHVRALGFDWDDDGRIRTAPTPATFNALLELATDGEAGYPLCLHREDATVTSTGPWLHRYLEGTIPVHVASRAFYAARCGDRDMGWHLTTLAHDLTVHALNYHLVPRAIVRDLGARIRSALGGRIADLDRSGAVAPVTLAWFFDNDLNRYCYEVWFRCARPSEFAATFASPENLAQLHAALETRIRETLDGRGDAATEEGAELEHVELRLCEVTRPTRGARQPRDR